MILIWMAYFKDSDEYEYDRLYSGIPEKQY